MGSGADYQVHICVVDAPAGQRWGGHQHLWPPVSGTVLLLETPPDWPDAGGVSGSSGSGAEHPAPQAAGAFTEELPSPRVSAASLRTLRSLYLRPSFFWFCFLSKTVVPKIANLRNHQEADTDANTRGFIYKLELVSMYARHSGAGTWTQRWVLALELGLGYRLRLGI